MGLLEDIRVFVRSVEKGSFSEAGRDLRLSAAVVSHRVLSLEQRLNCRLLNRTTRKMQLTAAGRSFFERCIDVMDAVERAESSVTGARGAIKVTAPLGLGRRLVAPMVTRFQSAHPELDIRLRLSDHLLDLIAEGIDIALRMASLDDSTFVLRKVADVERILCASPDYLVQSGVPKVAEDLKTHKCLLLRFPGSQQFRWTLLVQNRPITLPVRGPVDSDDGDILTGWALSGAGIALKPVFEVADHLASGALVPVLPDFRPPPLTLSILYPSRRLLSPNVKLLSDMLFEEGRNHIRDNLSRVGKRLDK
ncbi:LysR family transcriptional regulator [Afipia birgiae]|jgi:DNA-binding transcriptional LysR family regulator|uniref:LysR family transcriptional regulator n=1 Tax=Afipia birgiae TaxID=151414 RepID=UPI0002F50B74|nr:LysR family transcriptional regulator [Afipia birgiae]